MIENFKTDTHRIMFLLYQRYAIYEPHPLSIRTRVGHSCRMILHRYDISIQVVRPTRSADRANP